MCFHNAMSADAQTLQNRYDAKLSDPSSFQPIFHQSAFVNPLWPVISNSDPSHIEQYHWGLIPAATTNFKEAKKIRTLTYNARIETVAVKSSFRNALRSHRCLIPSTGFFEWQDTGSQKIPWFIRVQDTNIFSMAGIWDQWTDPDEGTVFNCFSIITAPASGIMCDIHNTKKRMPLILNQEFEKLWIGDSDVSQLLELSLKNIESIPLDAHTVGPLIGSKTLNTNVEDVSKSHTYYKTGSLF